MNGSLYAAGDLPGFRARLAEQRDEILEKQGALGQLAADAISHLRLIMLEEREAALRAQKVRHETDMKIAVDGALASVRGGVSELRRDLMSKSADMKGMQEEHKRTMVSANKAHVAERCSLTLRVAN